MLSVVKRRVDPTQVVSTAPAVFFKDRVAAETHYYNLHGFFRLAVRSVHPHVLRHFQAEYAAFQVDPFDDGDLDVTIGPFSVSVPDSATAFGRFVVTDDWVYARERYKVARWEFAFTPLAERTVKLVFDGGVFSLDFAHHQFVEPLLRYRVCERDVVLVGGGSVVKDGRAVLVSGLGQTGKTALTVRQVLSGWNFQSDDMTFVSSLGETYSYPRRLHITDHMFAVCPSAMRRLPIAQKLSIKSKKLIYEGSLRYGELQEAVTINQLVPRAAIEPTARLSAVLVLVAVPGTALRRPRRLKHTELLDRLMAINGLECRAFTDVLWACHASGKAVSPAQWWQTERALLERALDRVPGFEVEVPRDMVDRRAIVEHTGRVLEEIYAGLAGPSEHAIESEPLGLATERERAVP
jgi:hypothetical protein